MMHSNVLFIPVMFACTSNDVYKRMQKPFASIDECTEIVDAIKETFGLNKIGGYICPVMQLYNPVDFALRDIDLTLEILCEDSCKKYKKLGKFLPLKDNVIIIYNSTGIWPYEDAKPIFKPLEEISAVGDMVENGDIPMGQMAILYFMLPIIILHNSRKELDGYMDVIFEHEAEDAAMEKLERLINKHYNLVDDLIILPIADADFIAEEFDEIKKNIVDDMGSNGFLKVPIIHDKKIGRNELCPCGSGLKYKNCCINRLN